MQRVTVRVPEAQIDDIDRLVEAGEYPNRSELIREAVRDELASTKIPDEDHDEQPPEEPTRWLEA